MAGILAPPGYTWLTRTTSGVPKPLSAGYIYVYLQGTSTLASLYSDQDQSSNIENPARLDINGRRDIWVGTGSKYKIDIADSNKNVITSHQNVEALGGVFSTGITINGNFDVNGNIITTNSGKSLSFQPNGTGKTNIDDPVMKNDLDLDGNDIIVSDNTGLIDASSNELLKFNCPSSSVNNLEISASATGSGPILSSVGDDTNVELNFQAKGTGPYNFKATSTSSSEIRLFEDTDNGSNYIGLKSPNSVASSISFVLPSVDGSASGALITDGAQNLSFNSNFRDFVYLGEASPGSTSTSVTSLIDSTYDIYFLMVEESQTNNDDTVFVDVSTDNGSTWETTKYYSSAQRALNSYEQITNGSQWNVTPYDGANPATNRPCHFYLYYPSTSGKKTFFTAVSENLLEVCPAGGFWNDTTAVNALRFRNYAAANAPAIRVWGKKA